MCPRALLEVAGKCLPSRVEVEQRVFRPVAYSLYRLLRVPLLLLLLIFVIVTVDLYSSPNILRVIKSRRMSWAGHVARMGEERGAYRVLVGKPEGKRPLGRPRRRWVDNIRMDLREVGCGYVDWIGLAQDRDSWWTLVSAVMNLRVP